MKQPSYCRPTLCVVMDGIGLCQSSFGNAIKFAQTPNLRFLEKNGLYLSLNAHGRAVGLPSDADMGNSEVGHNALGAGKIYDQGAKLVQNAIETGAIFRSPAWTSIVGRAQHGTLHLIGLLSDGNVHSHEQHLYAILKGAKRDGINKCKIHVLLDGRDVGEKTAEIYADRLIAVMNALNDSTFDASVASGGGRMTTTMDRYEADWSMVERGWQAHVHGVADFQFPDLPAAIRYFREHTELSDQNLPPFVIAPSPGETAKIVDGDAVILFNFRGDRAIEITRAFTEKGFSKFDRGVVPAVYYAGMMQYDGDLKLPEHFLVGPPEIKGTFGEFLADQGLRQFACSETQKYGHVTYFWNGNRSGKFSNELEEYVEIPSDNISFDLKPGMKACEITDQTIQRMQSRSFDFGRINYPNGDMVGHTGNFEAAVVAVATVDLMIGRLIRAAQQTGTILVVTADHGNADEMFDAKENDFPNWVELPLSLRPKPKTSHTLNPVPCFVYDPSGHVKMRRAALADASLGNVAASCLALMGVEAPREAFMPSFVEVDE